MADNQQADNQVMMTLGTFRFSINRAAYQKLTKTYGWDWAAVKRFGTTDSLQFTRKQNPTMSLSGVIFPEFSSVGIYQVDNLSELGDAFAPLQLTTGYGEVWGYWCITKLTETQDQHMEAGIPTKQTFSMELTYYGESV